MSDVWVKYQDDEPMALVRERPATTDELIEAVRRGVNDGSIKGAVGRVEGASVMSRANTELLVWVSRDAAREIVRSGAQVLVVPVPDGVEDK